MESVNEERIKCLSEMLKESERELHPMMLFHNLIIMNGIEEKMLSFISNLKKYETLDSKMLGFKAI